MSGSRKCAASPCRDLEAGARYTGTPLQGGLVVTAELCRNSCRVAPLCTCWTWDWLDGRCLLFSEKSNQTYHHSSVSGSRTCLGKLSHLDIQISTCIIVTDTFYLRTGNGLYLTSRGGGGLLGLTEPAGSSCLASRPATLWRQSRAGRLVDTELDLALVVVGNRTRLVEASSVAEHDSQWTVEEGGQVRLVGTQLYLQPDDTTAVGPGPAGWQLPPALPHRILLADTCYQITGPHLGSPITKYPSFCSEEHPCSVGQGDCTWSLDCLKGLRCGTGNCHRYGSNSSLHCCEYTGDNNHTEVSSEPLTDWYSAFSTCSHAGGILAEIGDLFIHEVHGLEPNCYSAT